MISFVAFNSGKNICITLFLLMEKEPEDEVNKIIYYLFHYFSTMYCMV